MDIRVCDSDQEVAEVAAGIVEKTIRSKPGSAVLPASGNTPVPLYRLLGERKLPSSALRVFQLDEYVGVDGDDPRSLFGWLQRVLLQSLDIPEAGVTRLRGDAGDLAAECANYDRAVETAGGIDLAILGLGLDGHLGYNEPPSPADAPTRVVTLRPESRAAAAQYWPPGTRVPDEGITAGMDVILHARCILLLVTGSEKRYILRRVLEGPVTPEVPASYLRTVQGAIVVADREALEKG